MSFTLPWTVNKFISTNINDGDGITGGTYGNVSFKVNGKTQLVGNTVIDTRLGVGKAVSATHLIDVNGSINTTELNAPAIKLTGKNNLGVVKNVTGATTLTFADGEYINLQSATSYTVTLPLATASSIGARFVFFFSTALLAGTKTIQRSGTQTIYSTELGGGTVSSILMSPSTDFCIELVCIASSGTCWSMTRQGLNTGLVAYLAGPNVFTNLNTFQGGITASATQSINFGSNSPTMGGSNISGVVKTTGDETIAGIKTFSSPIVTSGAGITSASIPNAALQSNVALIDNPETISSLYTFTGGITASDSQTINFGTNAPAMSGASIAAASIPNSALQSTVALTNAPETITSKYTFTGGIDATAVQVIDFSNNAPIMSGTNISGVVKTTGSQSITGTKFFLNGIDSLTITPTSRPELSANKYVTNTNVLNWYDPQNIIFNGNNNFTTFLPSVVDGGVSRVGSRFTFGFTLNWTGTKTVQAQTGQFIYDGGNTLNLLAVPMTALGQHYLELLCVNYTPGYVCWAVVGKAHSASNPFTMTFTGGITATATQTINFGTNAPTMSGVNVTGIVRNTADQTIAGIKTFTSPIVTSGAGITAASIPNTALQSTVALTNSPETISSLYTFTGGITASASQTINFGTNAVAMSGANITSTSIPNSALQSTVALTNTPETITSKYTFTGGIDASAVQVIDFGTNAPTMSGANIGTATINANSVNNLFEDLANQNYGLGFGTGNYGGGDHNTSAGYLSMSKGALLTGASNSGYGGETLRDLETGSGNSVYGAFGFNVLTSGSYNTGIGAQCADVFETGSYNTICGALSATTISSISYNNCSTLGANTGISNGLNYATAIGSGVSATNSNQVRIGRNSDTTRIDGNLQVVTSATVPTKSPNTNTTDVATTAYIYRMLRTDDVSNNINCGLGAGQSLTSGYSNFSAGTDANKFMSSGYQNVSIGVQSSLYHNGYRNIAIGTNALTGTLGYTPTNNVAIGFSALGGAQNCDGNFALGASSLGSCTTGGNNAMMGYLSGGAITTGSYNNGLGYGALNTITTGERNCGIGIGCGGGITTGSRNTFLGDNTSATGDFSDSTAIGANSVITANNQIVIGTSTENIMIKGCQYIQGTAPIQTGSFTISASLIYQFYPIHITATATCTLPDASANLLGVAIRFRRVGGNAAALNSASSNIKPIASFTSNAVLLTASNNSSAGNAIQIICLPVQGTPNTYAWFDAA